MDLLAELKSRFAPALAEISDDPAPLLDMIRPAGNPQHGDYQANFAMPLKKVLGKPPREIAAEIVAQVNVADLCDPPEVAGPGFINLRLADGFLAKQLQQAFADERMGVPKAASPQTFVIDFSSPNVAKPMHVGHIRSTVIGDSIARTLRFLGHTVITDNHLGDWGTQFGMIIYGWKHFGDQASYDANPVEELVGVYRQVRRLMDYLADQRRLPKVTQRIEAIETELAERNAAKPTGDKKADKKAAQALAKLDRERDDLRKEMEELAKKIDAADADHTFTQTLAEHREIESAVLAETAKLHAGDEENLALWQKFLPNCKQDIQRIYDRLDVQFDYELGESFYHDRLADVVTGLESRGLATESEGATCVFLDEFDTPMIVRKRDGAYLYATTDLATIAYRIEQWNPDAIIYVVDHRQGEHFQKLFTVAKKCGVTDVDLRHVAFGTVLGDDGKPFKTRAGDTVGLEGLLDEAVARSLAVTGPNVEDDAKQQVAETIGHAAIKYADLSQNRESDYIFSFDKMVALDGNTAPYMMYAYARVQSIFARGDVDVAALRADGSAVELKHPEERALALALLRFSEALQAVTLDYRPNLLTAYLFTLAKAYSTFFEHCPVLKAETDELCTSRLKLCDLTARILKQGLGLLGINVVERM